MAGIASRDARPVRPFEGEVNAKRVVGIGSSISKEAAPVVLYGHQGQSNDRWTRPAGIQYPDAETGK